MFNKDNSLYVVNTFYDAAKKYTFIFAVGFALGVPTGSYIATKTQGILQKYIKEPDYITLDERVMGPDSKTESYSRSAKD